MTTTVHPSIWTSQTPYQIALDALKRFQWSVFPLDEEKKPVRTGKMHPDGQPQRLGWKPRQILRASPEEISYWQANFKPAAWAIITGALSNIVVLDFDGAAGHQTRINLGLVHPHVQTGSDGHHIYFRHPGWPVPTLNSKSARELGAHWPGLDIRADGGYAAFCGYNTSGTYRWLRSPEPEALDILPEELRRFLGLLEPPVSVASSQIQQGVGDATPKVSVMTLFIRAHHRIQKEGMGRNDTGFWLACQLRDNGYTLDAAKDIMRDYVGFVPKENAKGQLEPYTLEEALASATSAFSEAPRDVWTPAPAPSGNRGNGSPAPIPVHPIERPLADAQGSVENGRTPDDTPLPIAPKRAVGESLPEILIHTDQLRETVDQSIAAIVQCEQTAPSLFIQSARLVRVGCSELGRPLLAHMGPVEVREMLTHAANFYRLRKIPGHDEQYDKLAVSPPKELAEQILARQTQKPYLPFSTLLALIEAPVIRPDGSILNQPGYDPATQLYYVPLAGMEACTVPLKPTPQEREKALALLLSAIGEFPYVSDADQANALALLLTPILRPAIKRHVPLALIDAPKQGTGKGLLSDVVSMIATGKSAAILTLSNREDELQKLITSLLIEGSTIITLDNVTGCLQSRHLDAALTSDMWHGRILGMSKMTFVPQRATWIATGNNIKLGGDLARRCYRIRLDAKVSRPFMRKGFTHSDLVEWVSEQRADLIGALLTLARAWYAAGKPKYAHLPSLGTFSSWVEIVGGILEYAGVRGFLSNLERLYEDIDDDSIQWEAFFSTWHQRFGKEWVSLSQVGREIISTNNVGDWEEQNENALSETLPEALQIALKEKPQSFSVRLGKALEKLVDTCFGAENLHLEKARNAYKNICLWRVLSGGSGGSGDESSPTRNEKSGEKYNVYGEEKNEIGGDNPRNPRNGENGQSASTSMGGGTNLISDLLHTSQNDDQSTSSPTTTRKRRRFVL